MRVTDVFGFKKPEVSDNVIATIEDIAETFNLIETEVKKAQEFGIPWGGITTHVGNVYSIAQPVIASLVEGMAVSFKIDADSTDTVSLDWDGNGAKAVLKSTGAAITNWKAGGIYTVRYSGTAFTLQGEGGEYGTASPAETLSGFTIGTENGVENGTLALTGDAGAGDVLLNKTFYNTNAKSKGTGTMPNRGSVGTINLTTEGAEYVIPAGCHNGLGKVKAVISGLIAGVIKAGVTVGGIVGTFTADANAVGSQILSGASAYVNGVKIPGTIPSKGAATITPGTANQTITAGQYLSGIQTILGDPNLLSSKILIGTTIFTVPGSAQFGTASFTYGNPKLRIETGISASIGTITTLTNLGSVTITKLTGNVGVEFRLGKSGGWSSGSTTYAYFYVYKNGVQVAASYAQLASATTDPAAPVYAIPNVVISVAPGDVLSLYGYMSQNWGTGYYFNAQLRLVTSNDLI